jgi:antitoxin component of RelBE/YafQ-DinJ toxin-antitoxin module
LSDAEAVLAAQGLTVEDALVLFYRWCAYCPAEAAATIKQWAEAESVAAGV